MIKPNSVLRRKWFQITAATVGAVLITGGAVGGGVAAAIIKIATDKAKGVVSDLGVTPDEDTKSDIDNRKFASADAKLNVVALGDSVTAGYTSLSYNNLNNGVTKLPDGKNKVNDTDSYANYLAYQLKKANKLGTYNNLARDGMTSSGLLDSITDLSNLSIIKKSNLVVLTIGANDILRAVKFLGIPFSQLKNIIGNPLGTSSAVNPETATTQDYEALGASVGVNASYLPTLLANVQKLLKSSAEDLKAKSTALDDNFKALFSVDGQVLDTQLVNAASNILKALTFIHQASPGAKIIINEYQFPFNRYEHNGQNITEIAQPELSSLTFNGKAINKTTIRGVYDYVMDTLKDKTTSNFGVVEWNSLQDNQDAIIKTLVEDHKTDSTKGFATEEEAIAAFQRDITDIHPTQYSHALIGQYIFNNLLAGKINASADTEDYSALRDTITSAPIPQTSVPIAMLLNLALSNNGLNDTNNEFASALVDTMVSDMVTAAKVSSVEELDFTNGDTLKLLALGSPGFNMLTTLFPLLGGTATREQSTTFFDAVDKFIQSGIFGTNSALYDAFVKKPADLTTTDISPSATTSFGQLVGNIVAEAALAMTSPLKAGSVFSTALGAFVSAAVALPDADKRDLETKTGITANSLNAANSATAAVRGWLFVRLPIITDAQIATVTSTAAQTALTNLVNSFKQYLQLNTPYYAAAGMISGLTDAEKGELAPLIGATVAKLTNQESATAALIAFISAGLPANADAFANISDKPKQIITNLITTLNKAVIYANALATAYPAAFFTNYAANQKTQPLTFAQLTRVPSASNPLGHIAIAIN